MATTAPLLNLDILAAILSTPEDDGPRLEMADWLLENATSVPCPQCKGAPSNSFTGASGKHYVSWCESCHGSGTVPDGRAEYAAFIRVQCELARLEDAGWRGEVITRASNDIADYGEKVFALRRRDGELLEPGLLRHLPGPFWIKGSEYGYSIGDDRQRTWVTTVARRGFVDSITTDWSTFTTVASQLVRLSDPCGKCNGSNVKYLGSRYTGKARFESPCPDCTDGRVLRAVQPGMQPILTCRLSDAEPPADSGLLEITTHGDGRTRKFIHDDYAGISFEMARA